MEVSVSAAASLGGGKREHEHLKPQKVRIGIASDADSGGGDSDNEGEGGQQQTQTRKQQPKTRPFLPPVPISSRRGSSASLLSQKEGKEGDEAVVRRPATCVQICKLLIWGLGVVLATLLLLYGLRRALPHAPHHDDDNTPPSTEPWYPPGTNASNAAVAYDGRSVIVDGKRVILICGAIHYPRSDPEEWQGLLKRAKEGGLNCIETLVFWNLHEPTYRSYDFTPHTRLDLPFFLSLAASLDLFVILRLGPYICGEWDYGGIPAWLLDRKKFPDGVAFRTQNSVWQAEMRTFLSKVVEITRPFFHTKRGNARQPVIMLQIENEYGWLEEYNGEQGREYARWCVETAGELVEELPWFMCAQDNSRLVNTCNGFYCDQWIRSHRLRHPNQPPLWTEAWSGWFQKWGEPKPVRPAEDLAFAVARWFGNGGVGVNYYMYHGGTNFDRTAGGPHILTTYDYDAALREPAHLPNEPKYSHLARLHRVILGNADALFWGEVEDALEELKVVSTNQGTADRTDNWIEAHVFGDPAPTSTTGQIAFLSNIAVDATADVEWRGTKVELKAWSVVILVLGKGALFGGRAMAGEDWKVVYDTADAKDKKTPISLDSTLPPLMVPPLSVHRAIEPIGGTLPPTYPHDSRKSHARSIRNAEQIRTSWDLTDYQVHQLVYELKPGQRKVAVRATGVVELGYVFLGNSTCGGCQGGGTLVCKCRTDEDDITEEHGHRGDGDGGGQDPVVPSPPNGLSVNVSIITCIVGLDNYGARLEETVKGITGRVEVDGQDATDSEWRVLVGLYGEHHKFFEPERYRLDVDKATPPPPTTPPTFNPWTPHSKSPTPAGSPPIWYRLSYPLPAIDGNSKPPLFLDTASLGKGFVWVNGQPLGRFWNATSAGSVMLEADKRRIDAEALRWKWRAEHGYDVAPNGVLAQSGSVYSAGKKPSTGNRCDYRGSFDPWKCPQNRGGLSQHLLYIPWSWIEKGSENGQPRRTIDVVIFEERPGGADPWLAKLQIGELHSS